MKQVVDLAEKLFNSHLPEGVDKVIVDVIKRKNTFSISDLIFVVDDESPLLKLVEGQDNTKYYLRFDLLKTKWVEKYCELSKKYLGFDVYLNSHVAIMKKSVFDNTYRYSR